MPTYRALPSARKEHLSIANKMADEVLCLPMHHELTDNDIDRWEKQLKYNMNQRMFSIVSLSNDCLIGMCTVTIDDSNTEGEIEILIGSKSNRNKGYGTEAISQLIKYCRDELHLQSLVMRVLAQNFAAIKCYEKSGFVKSTATNSQQHDPIVIMRKTIS